MLTEIAVLIIATLALSESSSIAVDSAEKLSRITHISGLAIGFLLLSVLTSLPELTISTLASFGSAGDLAIGNVYGSVIANILLVAGVGMAIYGIKLDKTQRTSARSITLLSILAGITGAMGIFLGKFGFGRVWGAILLAAFVAYAIYVAKGERFWLRKHAVKRNGGALRPVLKLLVAVAIVLVSADFVVNYSIQIAHQSGLTEGIIGATLVAFGTSVPELMLFLQAARRKNYGLALGTAIGSNVVDLTLVLGTALAISPVHAPLVFLIEISGVAVIANILLMYVVSTRNTGKIVGATFLAIYVAYLLATVYI